MAHEKIKAVLINPKARIVIPVEYTGHDEMMEHLLEVKYITTIPIIQGDEKWSKMVCFCDENGLFNNDHEFTAVPWYTSPIAGPILVVGRPDKEGDETDCPFSAFEIAKDLLWLDRRMVFTR